MIDKKSFPQRYTDWFNYGGIARDVSFSELKGLSVLSSHIIYELDGELKTAAVCAELELYNANEEALSSPVCVKIDEQEIYNEALTLDGYERKVIKTPSVVLDNIKLWDTTSPYLYTV